jgi:hypothetical protein
LSVRSAVNLMNFPEDLGRGEEPYPYKFSLRLSTGDYPDNMQGNLNPYIVAMPPFGRGNGPFGEGARA